MKTKAFQHVQAVVQRGLAPSRCPEQEARAYWRALDPVEQFRLATFLFLEDEDDFALACVEGARRERVRRVGASGVYFGGTPLTPCPAW